MKCNMFHSTVNPGVPAAGAESGNSTPRRSRLVAAAEDEFGTKIRRPSLRYTERQAEGEEVFGVHTLKNSSFAITNRVA